MSLTRTGRMRRGSGLKTRTPLVPMAPKMAAKRAAEGDLHPSSTFARKSAASPKLATAAPAKRPGYTGPKRSVCDMVDKRSGKRCEFPSCTSAQDHRHHRLNRKAGGRRGEMRERLNSAAWLLGVCTVHHEIVTNPVGEVRETVERMGWVLREGQDATAVEVATRHHPEPVWLDNSGDWHIYEEASA